jgi:uncharacterized protein (DUF305 family)
MPIPANVLAGAALLAAAACAPAVPGAEPAPAPEAARADTGRAGYTAADVRFMQHMIAHHAQALEMTALVPERTPSQDVRLVAERMEVSQRDEIATMQRWLRDRGHAVPDAHAHHAAEHAAMPGILSAEEMRGLAAARGAEFDRLFLERMIRHHEGALVMVRELMAAPGAGQEPATFQIAAEVESDQRAEIARMRSLLAARAAAAPR